MMARFRKKASGRVSHIVNPRVEYETKERRTWIPEIRSLTPIDRVSEPSCY
jgi:hypothetical protein